jgi:hypothetical protein
MRVAVHRMWVNQPSAHQAYHKWHGTNVLAIRESETAYDVYFLSGPVISMRISHLALSHGWTKGGQ